MSELEMERDRGTYGPVERFVYLILIPALFTVVLMIVLLAMFGYHVTDPVLRVLNKVPVLERVVPDPRTEAIETAETEGKAAQEIIEKQETMIASLEAQLSSLNTELVNAQNEAAAKDARIAELEAQVEQLSKELEQKTISDEEYLERIRNLAEVYTEMSPSKAAPVLEQLTLSERVLVMNQMKPEAQVEILEKMNPVIAAETSILLKDAVPVRDQQIAALQSRLALMEEEAKPESAQALTGDELSLTIAGMAPANAAEVLLAMMESDGNAVIRILRGMDLEERSAVLDAISQADAGAAAKIAAGLDG